MKTKYFIAILFLIVASLGGCERYLELKPNQKLVVPTSVTDLQSLLNNTSVLSSLYPGHGEMAAGDFYLFTADWKAISTVTFQRAYSWDIDEELFGPLPTSNDWTYSYMKVYYANVVLDALDRGKILEGTAREKDDVYGQALFFRSFAFYNLLLHFAKPWDERTAHADPGIALRLSPDLNMPTVRTTVKDGYEQVVADLKRAVELLNEEAGVQTRPTKVAALSLLARVSLSMERYEDAFIYAGQALERRSQLLDFNDVDGRLQFPFARFGNEEVVFHALIFTSGAMYAPTMHVDETLLSLYGDNDLRKTLFFKKNATTNTHSYYGSYDGTAVLFNGLTTAELYLIRAECYARGNQVGLAMDDLNTLLEKRWDADAPFVPLVASSQEEALKLALQERRKELAFRGQRWGDLKRLNKDTRFQETLRRTVDGQEYTLPPNDNRYVLPIPPDVVQMTGIAQNPY